MVTWVPQKWFFAVFSENTTFFEKIHEWKNIQHLICNKKGYIYFWRKSHHSTKKRSNVPPPPPIREKIFFCRFHFFFWKCNLIKKSMAQEVRQRSHIPERRSSSPPSTLTLRHSRWVIVRPVRGHLTPKMNITFFIRN